MCPVRVEGAVALGQPEPQHGRKLLQQVHLQQVAMGRAQATFSWVKIGGIGVRSHPSHEQAVIFYCSVSNLPYERNPHPVTRNARSSTGILSCHTSVWHTFTPMYGTLSHLCMAHCHTYVWHTVVRACFCYRVFFFVKVRV